jgi:hypothetical protein
MVWGSHVQDGVINQNHKLFVVAQKNSGQGVFLNVPNHPIPYPLPKLCRGGPKLFSVATINKRRSFLYFLFAFHEGYDLQSHKNTTPLNRCQSTGGEGIESYPWESSYAEAAIVELSSVEL